MDGEDREQQPTDQGDGSGAAETETKTEETGAAETETEKSDSDDEADTGGQAADQSEQSARDKEVEWQQRRQQQNV